VLVHVTNAGDRGPGTLREAIFIVAGATGPASISIEVPQINLETALPALVNGHGVRLIGQASGVLIDAQDAQRRTGAGCFGPEYLDRSDCDQKLPRSRHPRACRALSAFRIDHRVVRPVGVEVAENASDTLLEGSHFLKNRLGVRFGASGHNSAVASNDFAQDKDAGLWAVRSAPDSHDDVIVIHDNKFKGDGAGIVAGNIPVLVERNDFVNSREAAVHLVGAGAVIRGNRINGGASMGIVAENATGAVIDGNTLEGLTAYGVMVRGSSNTLVQSNRLNNCGYGLAFVLGDARSASTVVGKHHHRVEIQRNRCDRRLSEAAAQSGIACPRFRPAR